MHKAHENKGWWGHTQWSFSSRGLFFSLNTCSIMCLITYSYVFRAICKIQFIIMFSLNVWFPHWTLNSARDIFICLLFSICFATLGYCMVVTQHAHLCLNSWNLWWLLHLFAVFVTSLIQLRCWDDRVILDLTGGHLVFWNICTQRRLLRRKRQCEHRDRGWSDLATAGNRNSQQKVAEASKDFPHNIFRRCRAVPKP